MKRLEGELYSLVEALLCLLIIISWIAGLVKNYKIVIKSYKIVQPTAWEFCMQILLAILRHGLIRFQMMQNYLRV